ncbi:MULTISPECIES: hypothetical protein [Pseudanabaena]|uniref:DUF3291 domain-containing protein n=2 Tax=Pseudanabaena TaxID=1152 RepID=L8N226_9CYAN|nr:MULTISPECIES: hypothetical protein [Pseudanabaena]ELS32775.1 hypothetical protein Pse7429DRAFT_2144 [Pseudanabaena biceps PCC 7429]MDG3495002.1 hypothetical protein [Pseudanabaena catenata USMAC16]
MFYLSMTRLKLKSPLYLIPFFIQNKKILNQLRASQGFVKGKILAAPNLSMWTVTLWSSEEDLRAFYLNGEHGETIEKINEWSSDSVRCHQLTESDAIPSWENIRLQLTKSGRFRDLTEPSFDQISREIPKLGLFCLQKTILPVQASKKYKFTSNFQLFK